MYWNIGSGNETEDEGYSAGYDEKCLRREEILKRTLEQGPAWEISSNVRIAMVYALKGKGKAGPSRLGAKKVKSFERLESPGEVLNPSEATSFRALSARANYLALDRPDIAYSAKELCR